MQKKSCRETIELLMDYLEGRLSPEEHQALKIHFEDCPPCLDFVDSYQATPRILREATAVQVPPEVERELKEYLQKNRRSK